MFQLVSLQVLDKVTFFSLYFKFFTQSTLLSGGGKSLKRLKFFFKFKINSLNKAVNR